MATSLEILRPSPSSTHELPAVDSLARYLENKSSVLIRLMTKIHFSNPVVQQYLDTTCSPWNSPMQSQQGQQLLFRHLINPSNGVELDILNISADVREEEGRASVSMLINLPKNTRGLGREIIAVMQWRLTAGVWKCYEQTASYGGSNFGI